MATLSIITFFGSLLGLGAMIGRKFVALKRAGGLHLFEGTRFELPYLDEIKGGLKDGLKKLEHTALVFLVRMYIRGKSFVRSKYRNLKKSIRRKLNKEDEDGNPREVSKFLQMLAQYKERVDEMKKQIKKEEKNS